MYRYANKYTVILYGLFFFGPIHHSVYVGHFSWKRGKLPRLTHNDMKIVKFMNNAPARHKYILGPALDIYPDNNNALFQKYIKQFLKKKI